MLEQSILIAQTASVGLIAAWLTTGVVDNIRHPEINEAFTAQVMKMTRMKEGYPDEYAQVAHRAITSRSIQKLSFRLVVAAELMAALVLWAGVVALLMALAGVGSVETGKAVALLGATLFLLIWGGFLVVGNYFSYWFCHEGAQNTHYQMTLWGLGNMIFLAAA